GPSRFPPFFSFYILTGIFLHRGSPEGVSLLKSFLGAGGGLEKWLKFRDASQKTIDRLVRNTSVDDDINAWASQEKQTMEESAIVFIPEKDLSILRELVAKGCGKIMDFKNNPTFYW